MFRCTAPEAELLFTTEGNLRSLSLDGHTYTTVVSSDTGLIQSIDFDFRRGTVYWNDLDDVSMYVIKQKTLIWFTTALRNVTNKGSDKIEMEPHHTRVQFEIPK